MSQAPGIAGAPRIPAGAVVRGRLLERLAGDEALHVVRGPSGAGKTVLLAQWAQRSDRSGIWVTVDRPQTTASALVRLVVRALRVAGRVRGDESSSIEAALDTRGDAWELLAGVIAGQGRLQLVIDDADRLDDRTLSDIIDVVRRTPALRVLASARRSSPLTEPGVPLVLDTVIVDAGELAFTPAETAALPGLTASGHDPVVLTDVAGGLAIAVRALVLSGEPVTAAAADAEPALAAIESYYALRAGNDRKEPNDPSDQSAPSDRDDKSQLRRFLLRTSVAEVLTVELATELSGEQDSARLLDTVEADGLGMWTGHGSSRQFAYTTLVRELLQRDLRRSEPAVVERLLRRVARWSLQNDRPFSALTIALTIGDLTLATEVVRQAWLQLLASHAAQTRELFAGTTLLTLRKYPIITMMLALNFNASGLHRTRAVQLFGLAVISARTQRAGASAPDRALLRTMESASLRVTGRFNGADEAALDAFDILQHMSPAERDELGRLEPTLWAHIGTTFLYTGRTEQAITCFRAGIAIGDALQRPSALSSLALLAGTLAIGGDIDQAEAVCREARTRIWPPRWIDGYAGSLYQIAEALIALEHGDADSAERRIRSLEQHRETIEHWPLIDHVEAMIALLRARPAAALTRLDASISAHRRRSATSPQTLQQLALTRAVLQLARGDSDAASHTLSGAARRAGGSVVGQARVALARGDHAGAIRLALLARREPLSTRLSAEADVIRLAALLRAGRDAESQDIGTATLELLTDHDLAFPFALVTAVDLAAIQDFARRLGRDDLLPIVSRPWLRSLIPDQEAVPVLSDREQVVLRELLQNGSTTTIAATLSVSPNTVKSQLRSIYRKLGVTNREDAIAVATTRRLDTQ